MSINNNNNNAAIKIEGQMNEVVIDLHGRVTALERAEAKRSTEIALIQQDLAYIKAGQDKVSQGINRVLWTIILALVGAATTFVISGGLSVAA